MMSACETHFTLIPFSRAGDYLSLTKRFCARLEDEGVLLFAARKQDVGAAQTFEKRTHVAVYGTGPPPRFLITSSPR